jgi:hypothetical protein
MYRGRPRHAAIAIFLLAGAASFYFWGDSFPLSPCPFKLLTGYPCPGCGGMRATTLLLHGHAREALEMNPLSVLVATFAALSLCWMAWDVARGRSTYWNIYKIRWSRPAIIAAVALLLLNWAWNIYKGV